MALLRAKYDRGMRILASILLVTFQATSPISSATAMAERIGDEIEVEFIVEVDQTATTVIVHLVVGGDDAQQPVSLSNRGGRTFGGFVRLPVQDAVVVFEVLDTEGGTLSEATTLGELGVDLTDLGVSPLDIAVPQSQSEPAAEDNRRWLWLALAASAAALSLLAFRSRWDDPAPVDESSAESPDPDPPDPDAGAE